MIECLSHSASVMDRIMTDKVAEKTENKVSDSDLKKQASEDEARLNARARKFRHIGFGIFGGFRFGFLFRFWFGILEQQKVNKRQSI